MSGVIRWEDPPPAKGQRRDAAPWALIANQLRERPGEWALIYEGFNPTLGHRIRNGKGWWAPAGAFETVTRLIGPGIQYYARYVGTNTKEMHR